MIMDLARPRYASRRHWSSASGFNRGMDWVRYGTVVDALVTISDPFRLVVWEACLQRKPPR